MIAVIRAEYFVIQLAIQKFEDQCMVILLVILYGHVSWFLTPGEERRLRVFENRVLRRIFEPKWNEVTGEWRRLRTEKFMICTIHQILLR
jgi:hypothetical protein